MTGQQLKNSILQLAVQGKLVPQDPADEPASALLERIRAEKEQLVKEGKIKKEKNPSYIYRGKDGHFYERVGKKEPICIDEELPFEIPEGWEWARLENLFNVRSAMRIHQTDWRNSGIPFFRGRELVQLSKTGNVEPEIFISQELYQILTAKGGVPKKDDILISAVGTVGRTYIVKGSKKFYYKDAYILCLENIGYQLNPRYIKSTFDSPFLQQEIHRDAMATTVSQLTIKKAKTLLVPVPPFAEQQRIVAKIDKLMPFVDRYDALEKQLQALNTTFPDQLKKSILQEAIQGKLVPQDPADEPASILLERIRAEKDQLIKDGKIKREKNPSHIFRSEDGHFYERVGNNEPVCIDEELPFEIPESWEWARFDAIATFLNGDRGKNYPHKDEYTTDGIAWINTGHIQKNGSLDISSMNYISPEKFNSLRSGKIQRGDLLYCLRGATFGKTAKIEPFKEGAIASSLMIIRFFDLSLGDYIFYYLRSDFAYQQLHLYNNGSAQPNLAAKDVKKYLIPLPPLAEQQRIVDKIEQLDTYINQLPHI